MQVIYPEYVQICTTSSLLVQHCSSAVCTHFRYIRGQMSTAVSNVETLPHTESQVGLSIQHEGLRPVGTDALRESSHAGILVQFGPSVNRDGLPLLIDSGEGGTSALTGSGDGSTVRSQIRDEAADDDVIMSSAREFEQAKRKKNQRRSRGRTLDSEGQSTRISPNNLSKRIRGPSNLEIENAWSIPQKKLEFTCPVCLGPIVQEMSTKCGHVFCKDCITQSIATQGKCPVCRTKISMKDTIKIYLPMAT